jgi:hypothetical protein
VYALLTCAVCAHCAEPTASDLDPTLPNAIKASVFFDPISGPWVGSGTAIATNGTKTLILTAAHVVRGSTIEVVWYDGRRSAGEVFYRDKKLDAAIAVVDGPALAVSPIAKTITDGQTWAVGFPGRKGPTTRRVEFKRVSGGRWIFDVKGGGFGGGSSGSGTFRNGFLVAMTTHGDAQSNNCIGRDALAAFVAKSAEDRPKDCPLDLFGIFRSGSRRGRSQLDLSPNILVKQLPGQSLIPGIGRQESARPAAPPREVVEQADRIDRLEDSFRDFRASLLKDVAALVAQELATIPRSPIPARAAVPARADTDVESRVEMIMEAQERLERDKAKLLAELRRRSEQYERLANQLEDRGDDVK